MMSPVPEASDEGPSRRTGPFPAGALGLIQAVMLPPEVAACTAPDAPVTQMLPPLDSRSEEHTSELQSLRHLVCRLLLEKKKKKKNEYINKMSKNTTADLA